MGCVCLEIEAANCLHRKVRVLSGKNRLPNSTRQHKDQRKRMFSHGVFAVTWYVRHHNSSLGAECALDMIEPGRTGANRPDSSMRLQEQLIDSIIDKDRYNLCIRRYIPQGIYKFELLSC